MDTYKSAIFKFTENEAKPRLLPVKVYMQSHIFINEIEQFQSSSAV